MRNETDRRHLAPLTWGLCSLLLAVPAVLADALHYRFDAAPGGLLRIVAEGSSIDIETGAYDTVEVDISRRGDSERRILRDYDIEVYQKDGEIVVDIDRDRVFGGFFGLFSFLDGNLEIDIRIPKRFDLNLTTSGGSIQIADLEGSVEARTSGGSLRFRTIDGPVTARTSGGSITIEECSGETHVRTSGGSIRLNDVGGTVHASTSGGSVRAYISKQPQGDSSFKTSGGSVVVYLDDSIAVNLEARTSGGRVSSDFDLGPHGSSERHRLIGELNGGGPELYLRTSGGSIKILRR